MSARNATRWLLRPLMVLTIGFQTLMYVYPWRDCALADVANR
jgi:hypothetical protein